MISYNAISPPSSTYTPPRAAASSLAIPRHTSHQASLHSGPHLPSLTIFIGQMESESYTFGPYKISAKEVFYSTQLSYALVNLRPVVPDYNYRGSWVKMAKQQKLKETSLFDVISFSQFIFEQHIVIDCNFSGSSRRGWVLVLQVSQLPHHKEILKFMLEKARSLAFSSVESLHHPYSHLFGPWKRISRKIPNHRFIDLTADETSDLWLTAQKIGHQLESYHNASSLTFTIQDGPQAGQTVSHVHIHILPRKSGDFENNDEIYEAIDSKEKELKQKLDLDKERKDRSMEEMAQEAAEYRKLFL
ncbi:UNVERIFIED_CONTAM: Bifunctional bis(5'-adenosyl)-triphosphatase/adenylylsulfatase FHIT [Sesamum indicum]